VSERAVEVNAVEPGLGGTEGAGGAEDAAPGQGLAGAVVLVPGAGGGPAMSKATNASPSDEAEGGEGGEGRWLMHWHFSRSEPSASP